MIKKDLVKRMSEEQSVPYHAAETMVDDFISILKTTIENGEEIEIRGFGSFRIHDQGPRPARNPKTGDEVMIPARKRVFFKPSKRLKIVG